MTMLQACGPEYVAAWLGKIARQSGLAEFEVSAIVQERTGRRIAGDPASPDAESVREVVGALDGPTAKSISAQAREFARVTYPHGRCDGCGLALDRWHRCGECR